MITHPILGAYKIATINTIDSVHGFDVLYDLHKAHVLDEIIQHATIARDKIIESGFPEVTREMQEYRDQVIDIKPEGGGE